MNQPASHYFDHSKQKREWLPEAKSCEPTNQRENSKCIHDFKLCQPEKDCVDNKEDCVNNCTKPKDINQHTRRCATSPNCRDQSNMEDTKSKPSAGPKKHHHQPMNSIYLSS